MTETECPYCGHTQDEPDECHEEDELYETECDSCGKTYGIRPYYVKYYSESKMDCANGEDHNWIQMYGSPKEFFEYKRLCSWCGEEKIIDEAKHKENMERYFKELQSGY